MMQVLSGAASSARLLIERVHENVGSLDEEYPLVFEQSEGEHLLAIGEQGEARSACALLPRDFVFADRARLRGGLIGSVSTDPAFRGKGLGSLLINEAEKRLKDEQCAFSLLWAKEPGFYFRMGYCPIGIELDYAIDGAAARRLPAGQGVRPMREEDSRRIHRLYEKHEARLQRSEAETHALLRCPGMQTLVQERDGTLVAYACLGRGSDLQDVIHEWGGDAHDLLALIRAHHEMRFGGEQDGVVYLMSPPFATDLHRVLDEAGIPVYEGFLGLAKIVDRERIAGFLDERLGEAGQAELIETPEGQCIRLSGDGKETWIDDDAALALLFPVSDLREKGAELLGIVGIETTGLPVYPFAWGLDSI